VTDALGATLQRTLGDGYRVDRELGGGGMSRVFVAHDLSLDRDVVVKVLSEEATAGVSAERFRREIQLIARLQHPHVVSILSAGSANGALYYMMPYVAGETLRSRIGREGPLPVADVVRLLREVLDALAFAHDHQVVHRDIKPENVLVSSGHAVVADFGIAKALRESGTLTSAGFALGTPTYMAPEQATADPTTDHRADLYSVGVLGYELLTGAAPFSGTAQQVITQHLTTTPAPLRSRRTDVPDALASLLERALAKDPATRPQSAREMIAALDAVATPARAISASAPVVGRRTLVAAGALVAIVAAGVFALRSRTGTATAAPVTEGADLIAVMPLSAVSDTSLARLGQDIVVTLSANLDGVGSLRTVDAATLLMRARRLPSPLPLGDARAAARDLGARSVVTGTLINQGDRVLASVALHRVGSDSAIAKATALAAPHDIAALTDSLTWGILRQVWQRGTPPSPVLAGLTTRSVDALRAFLDGERHFQRLEVSAAEKDYGHAFELDSNFAQAYLRYEYVRSYAGNPTDAHAHARLLALKDRLPERERSWVEAFEKPLPVPADVARWDSLALRYPDYPPILMQAADPIIHSGPFYGIPIGRARPYLDRLEQLVPDHADTRFHIAMVSMAIGSADSSAASLRNSAGVMGKPWGTVLRFMARYYDAEARGVPLRIDDSALAVARDVVAEARRTPYWVRLTGYFGIEGAGARERLAALERSRAAGILSGDLELASALGEGLLRTSRGDWTGGLRALRRAEGSSLGYTERVTSARVAVLGAWLGAVEVRSADSTLQRVQAMPADGAVDADRLELGWLDGVVGVLLGDEPRVQRVRRSLLADTSIASRHAARSLAGLWLARTNADAAADTLKAVSDLAMRGEPFLPAIEAIDRLVIARSMRKRGTPGEAERYLMWIDASSPVLRNGSVKSAMASLVSYERGVAFDEAGNRAAASFWLRRFLTMYDQPPVAHRAIVGDARSRLVQLEATDAAPRRTIAPR
jgi:TolB-like protein